MARKRKRDRPRESNDKQEKRPVKKANVVLWSLGIGILLGTLAFAAGMTSNLRDAIVLGTVGLSFGALAGAIAAVGPHWPTNRYRSGWRRKIPSVRAGLYRPESPVPHLSDEYYYESHETYENSEEDEDD